MEKQAMDNEIDIVVLWVDGSDPEWLKQKAEYQDKKITDANAANRFRDWGLMKYWFRSIEAFAPWVRKIHFVTWGHYPEFLKTDHPKLHIVNHRDYLPEECLPTFNANAIEMNIHRIEGLAEQFLFFNDDMFLLRPVSIESFFRNGLPVVEGNEAVIPPVGKLMVWHSLYNNALGIINSHFSKPQAIKQYRRKYINRVYGAKVNLRTLMMELLYSGQFVGFSLPHSVSAFRKQTFEEVWKAEPDLLRETTAHRFRTYTDLNQWLVLWWQIAGGQFSPGKVDNALFSADSRSADTICETIRSQSHNMICINDPDQPTDYETVSKKIREAFDSILPNKCSFEV